MRYTGHLWQKWSMNGIMREAIISAGAFIFSSFLVLEDLFMFYGLLIVTCFSSLGIVWFWNKGLITSKSTKNGTGKNSKLQESIHGCLVFSFLGFGLWLFCFLNRDNFLILQALIASVGWLYFPILQNLPALNFKGFLVALILHVGISEPLYYWIHRNFHGSQYLFTNYHSLHHSSPVPQSFTG